MLRMYFAVTPEQEMLRDAVRTYLSDKVPLSGSVGATGFNSWPTAFPASGNEIQLFVSDASDNIVAAAAIPIENGRDHSAAFPDGSDTYYVSAAGSRDAATVP